MKGGKRRRNGTVEEVQVDTLSENNWCPKQQAPDVSINYLQQQMINDSNSSYRCDVSGPLNLKTGEASNNYFYSDAQKQPGQHTQLPTTKHFQQMQPPQQTVSGSFFQSAYPINLNAANEQANKLQEIDKILNGPYGLHAAQSYLSQLAYQQHIQNPVEYKQYMQPPGSYTSSYYTLTPASSVSSLHDFKQEPKPTTAAAVEQPKRGKCTLSRTDSKKRARTTTLDQTVDTDATTANLKKSNASTAKAAATTTTTATTAAAPKRRGRPPKNPKTQTDETTTETKSVVQRSSASAGLARSNSSIDSSTTSKFNSKSTKLIKSLINKSSSNSNLQKSKVQTSDSAPKPDENKKPSETTTTNLGNKTNQQQSQITGYLVDRVNTVEVVSNNKSNGLNVQEYTALKIAGVSIVKPNGVENTNNSQQLNPTNQSIYTGYYNKVKSIRSNADLNLTADEYTNVKQLEGKSELLQEPSTPMPKLSWANNHELWQTMLKKDAKYVHDAFYLKRHINIEPQMRAILLDWLVEISYAYRLHRETWHLALEYMDRFMTSCKQQMRVDRLQLIGMTCLFLAAKVEEIYPPKLKELASHMENYSNNNEDAISQFELFILKTLNWEISPVTANTWLMTYVQIASLNYYSLMNNTAASDQPLNSHMVMPLNIYKNSNASKLNATVQQQQFYTKNYMKSVTLLDLCMFEMDSMKFSYSVLAASAMYHMLAYSPQSQQDNAFTTPLNQNSCVQQAAKIVELSTGYKMYELDACVKWMFPFADVCKDILTEEKMTFVKTFSSVEQEDSHNIQLYHQNLELLKEAQSRKTPCKFYSNPNQSVPIILTPPDSHRKHVSSNNGPSMSMSHSTPANLNSNHCAANPVTVVYQN